MDVLFLSENERTVVIESLRQARNHRVKHGHEASHQERLLVKLGCGSIDPRGDYTK